MWYQKGLIHFNKHLRLIAGHHGHFRISTQLENVENTSSDNSLTCSGVIAIAPVDKSQSFCLLKWKFCTQNTAQMEINDVITFCRHFCQLPLKCLVQLTGSCSGILPVKSQCLLSCLFSYRFLPLIFLPAITCIFGPPSVLHVWHSFRHQTSDLSQTFFSEVLDL